MDNLNYTLNVSKDGMVNYYMENGNYPVTAKTTLENAIWMLERGKVRVSDKHKAEGFLLTSDDVYFFDGQADQEPKPKQRRKRAAQK